MRFKKIFKNVIIGCIVYGISEWLIKMNTKKSVSEACSPELNPVVNDNQNENNIFINHGTICYQTVYNYYVLSLI